MSGKMLKLLQYFKENPDAKNPAYGTKNGIYKEGCGLDNVMISWGHDDYMYLVLFLHKYMRLKYVFFLGYKI